MAEVLGVIAFLLAMGAVWLANEALRRVEDKNDQFVKAYINEIRGSVEESSAVSEESVTALNALKGRMEALEKDLREFRNESGGDMNSLKSEIENLQADILSLDLKIKSSETAIKSLAPDIKPAPAGETSPDGDGKPSEAGGKPTTGGTPRS